MVSKVSTIFGLKPKYLIILNEEDYASIKDFLENMAHCSKIPLNVNKKVYFLNYLQRHRQKNFEVIEKYN
jgi:hypothetical protein